MSAQKGKAVLIKIGDGGTSESFTAIAGLRSKQITLNAEQVDITNADSTNQWRELLADAGVKSVSVSGNGVFTDGASEESARAAFFASSFSNWQILVPDFGTFTGAFQVTQLEYSGEYNDAAQYALTLESAGAITFASV